MNGNYQAPTYFWFVNFQLKKTAPETKNPDSFERQLTEMTSQVEQSRNEANKAQAEADRLQEVLKEAETEKVDKDAQITEFQE